MTIFTYPLLENFPPSNLKERFNIVKKIHGLPNLSLPSPTKHEQIYIISKQDMSRSLLT
jgi:hypothetical protein